MSKIIDIVKFNDGHAFVLDEDYGLTYEKHGSLLIGSDETNTFFDVLYYQYPVGRKEYGSHAFGGRKFDLPMKDGTVTACWGQYWSGRTGEAEKILGVQFASFTHKTAQRLAGCYVFCAGMADAEKLRAMLSEFESEHPNYEPWGYDEYREHLKEENATSRQPS